MLLGAPGPFRVRQAADSQKFLAEKWILRELGDQSREQLLRLSRVLFADIDHGQHHTCQRAVVSAPAGHQFQILDALLLASADLVEPDRKSTRLNSSHRCIS